MFVCFSASEFERTTTTTYAEEPTEMTIENQANLNRIRNPVLAQLSEEARHVESQSRCNSKACICYGNAIIAITLFIFSFCSIVFIIIFVEYEVIENSIEHHTIHPASSGLMDSSTHPVPARHHSSTTEQMAVGEERSAAKGILDAIDNRPTDEDDPEEGRQNQYDVVNTNGTTKANVSAGVLDLDPGKILHYMTKTEWQTDEPVASPLLPTNVMQPPPKLLALPTKRIIVSHTGGKTCNSTVN